MFVAKSIRHYVFLVVTSMTCRVVNPKRNWLGRLFGFSPTSDKSVVFGRGVFASKRTETDRRFGENPTKGTALVGLSLPDRSRPNVETE